MKLGENNSSVFDIYTGLKIGEAQVKVARETEVKRMLEFEVCEEVSEELGPWQENLEQYLAGLTEESGSGAVETGGQPSPRCMQTL